VFVVYNSSFTGVQQKLSMDHVDSSAVPGDPQCRAVWVLSRGKQDPHSAHTVKYPMGTLTHLRLYIWDAPGAGPNWLKRTWRMAVFAAYDESDNDEREAHYNHSTMKLIDTPKLALK